MRIFVAGASGRVASALLPLLADQGHHVTAAARNIENIQKTSLITPLSFDLHMEKAGMIPHLEGHDAVYFVAGSRGRDLLQTDAFGAVKLMEAAGAAKARRFVMLSSLFSMQPEEWAKNPGLAAIMNYNIAKFFADEWLTRNTDLEYTIVQPTALAEEPGTGKISLNPLHEAHNPIPDVAAVLAAVLTMPNTRGKVITMSSGDTPIPDALADV